MKLSLIVASGVHEGKPIPINVPQFVVGRDPQCQLRPASPSISKRHCAITVRGQKVFIQDFGSTNGTFVNDKLVEGEVELKDQDRLKVGPLDFKVALQVTAAPAPKPAAAPAAKKPAGKAADDDAIELTVPPSDGPSSDNIADLLLDDDGSGTPAPLDSPESVPEGSTVMELPTADKSGRPAANKPKTVLGTGNTSAAAADILKRYRLRPRG